MKLWTFSPNSRIVQLAQYRFCWESYALLVHIQHICPNQQIDIVGGNDRSIPIHLLNLEDYRDICAINANG